MKCEYKMKSDIFCVRLENYVATGNVIPKVFKVPSNINIPDKTKSLPFIKLKYKVMRPSTLESQQTNMISFKTKTSRH